MSDSAATVKFASFEPIMASIRLDHGESGFDSLHFSRDCFRTISHRQFVMNLRKIQPPRINLNVPAGAVPLTMDMQKFFEFSFWIAEELLDLEAQYANWQTPASIRGKPFFQIQTVNGNQPGFQ